MTLSSKSIPSNQLSTTILAFAAIYIIWGTTYLAIRVAVETIPPFFMAGVRFLIAGLAVFLFLRARGGIWMARRETREEDELGCELAGACSNSSD